MELHEEHDDALDTDDHHNSDGGRLDDWRIDEGLDTIQRILREAIKKLKLLKLFNYLY